MQDCAVLGPPKRENKEVIRSDRIRGPGIQIVYKPRRTKTIIVGKEFLGPYGARNDSYSVDTSSPKH